MAKTRLESNFSGKNLNTQLDTLRQFQHFLILWKLLKILKIFNLWLVKLFFETIIIFVLKNMKFTGNYSRLSAAFEFKRLWMSYVYQVYIPCTMLVIMSWLSFFLKSTAYNVRLMLCTTSLLLMTLSCQILSTQVPRTNYIKSIDVFTGVCMTLIFAALMGKKKMKQIRFLRVIT